MLTRRAVVAALAALALAPGIDARQRNTQRRKRKRRQTPEPFPSASFWLVENAPRTIPVRCGAGPEWIGPVRAAAETWNRVQPWLRLDVQEIAPPAAGTMPDPDTILVVAAQADAWWGGLTEVVPSDQGIVAARITFDDADYAGHSPWPRSNERERVAAHELGHALGLTHAPGRDPGCMAPDPRHHPAPRPSGWTLRQLALTYGGTPPQPARNRRNRHR